MRCVAALFSEKPAATNVNFETRAGQLRAGAGTTDCSPSTWGRRDFAGTRFRWRRNFADTRAIELQIGPIDAPILHSPSVVSMGNPHAIFWVDDPSSLRSRHDRAAARKPSDVSRARQYHARRRSSIAHHVVIRTWERGAGLTKACGSAACAAAVAAARLKRTGRNVHGHAARRRSRHRMARARRPCADDRAGRHTSTKGRFDPALFAGAGAAR